MLQTPWPHAGFQTPCLSFGSAPWSDLPPSFPGPWSLLLPCLLSLHDTEYPVSLLWLSGMLDFPLLRSDLYTNKLEREAFHHHVTLACITLGRAMSKCSRKQGWWWWRGKTKEPGVLQSRGHKSRTRLRDRTTTAVKKHTLTLKYIHH